MTCFLGFIFISWLFKAIDALLGISHLKRLPLTQSPLENVNKYKKVSLIFAARNEASTIDAALQSMLAIRYEALEIIAVNDRSEDETGAILKRWQAAHPGRLKVITIQNLTPHWLGKNHALYEGYKASSGQWLLFTDADVHFHGDCVTSAMNYAEEKKLDHLTLFPDLITKKPIESFFTNYFALIFNLRFRPWKCSDVKSKSYVGIGAFNLVRREAYEKMGTHATLAMEVADDMVLGKLIKRNHFKQEAQFGNALIEVRWVEGWKGVWNSLRKNAFRGVNYNFFILIAATLVIVCADILPYLGAFFLNGVPRLFCLGTLLMIALLYAAGERYSRNSALTFLAHPFVSSLFLIILWFSAWDTLRWGGVRWRNTVYPVKTLAKEWL